MKSETVFFKPGVLNIPRGSGSRKNNTYTPTILPQSAAGGQNKKQIRKQHGKAGKVDATVSILTSSTVWLLTSNCVRSNSETHVKPYVIKNN